MDDKVKRLNLMRYWLVGIFALVFAGVTAFIYLPALGNIWMAVSAGWPIWGLTGLLCLVIYFGYRWYINRK
jgi:hypothetical protein